MKDGLSVASAYIGLTNLTLPYEAHFRDQSTLLLEEFADLETLAYLLSPYVRRAAH